MSPEQEKRIEDAIELSLIDLKTELLLTDDKRPVSALEVFLNSLHF